MKVAIVGSGISGLGVAHALSGHAQLSLFEAGGYFGGHTHTVDVSLPTDAGRQVTHGVDTGFLVFNEKTYPQLIRLFSELGVETAKSDMSFSVQVAQRGGRKLEWSGSSLNTVFAQRRNLFNRPFLTMLRDLARFNAMATRMANDGVEATLQQPLGEFLREHRFSDSFCNWYFLPMMGCIWSCPTAQMLQFPVATMIRFCHNHGLIQVSSRPQWWTVRGGAKHYVEKITANVADKRLRTPVRWIRRHCDEHGGVELATDHGTERFDKVVIATHSDQALALLRDASDAERRTLGAIRYHPNHAVLHTDTSVLPARKAAWAAWNYESAAPDAAAGDKQDSKNVCLHYLINLLQPLPWSQPVVVSLNPLREIPRSHVMGQYDYTHPVFDLAAIKAQGEVAQLQGRSNTYFCGAWMGYGFHEDGLKAGQGVAQRILDALQSPNGQGGVGGALHPAQASSALLGTEQAA